MDTDMVPQSPTATTELTYEAADGSTHMLAPGTDALSTWLAEPNNTRFVLTHADLGKFILRKERKQRGGWYWSMYRRNAGRLHKRYLGRSEDLTIQRLHAMAIALAESVNDEQQLAHPPPSSWLPSSPATTPLLAARLTPPPARAQLVKRGHLVQQLTAALDHPLTLIAAPAGSGKTTLLAAWAAQSTTPVAWLALDASDNDPGRFLAYLCAAVDRLQPGVSATATSLLQSPQPVPAETVLTLLLNSFDAHASGGALVLDDYHLITAPAVHAALAFLVDHLPPRLRLLIASRTDPPLPLPRLRARDQLAELRATDLRFSLDEAARFLSDVMGLQLSAAEVAILEQRTEGWVAGLHLAALAVQGRVGGTDVVAAATGSQRAIVDYLASEVLEGQPAPIQQFLLRTAVLERLSGELCDAVMREPGDALGGQNSQAMLEQLERANLFLVPLDAERQWYRYHQLFGDFLRARLQRTSPELIHILYRRAALWYADHDLLSEAIDHALAASDHDLAARLIEQCGRSLLMRSAAVTVLGWIDALPPGLLRTRPQLGLIGAWGLVATSQLDAGVARLDLAEDALAATALAENERNALEGEVLAVRAAIAGLKRDLPRTVALSEAALKLLGPKQAYVRSVVAQLLGGAAYASGDTESASRALDEALQLSRTSGNLFITIFSTRQLADVRVAQGHLHEAARLYQDVLGLDPTVSSGDEAAVIPGLSVTGTAYVGLGELYYAWNNVIGAANAIERGMALGEAGQNAEILLRGALALARVRAATGNQLEAEALLTRAATIADTMGAPWLKTWVAAERARWNVITGDLTAAVRWADSSELESAPVSYLYEPNYLALARVRVAQGRAAPSPGLLREAYELLLRLRQAAESAGRLSSMNEILTLEVLAAEARGDIASASATLQRVVRLAQPEGYVRVFVDAGAPMAALLQHLLQHAHRREIAEVRSFIIKLRAAFEQPGTVPFSDTPPMPEPLSARELEVLRLIAAGLSNQEIARALLVAVGTIKKHVNNIFGKLGVESRTQALVQARECRLLV